MTAILNLTQHPASQEQRTQGVIDFEDEELATLRELLTFNALPSAEDVLERAEALALLALHSVTPWDEDGEARPGTRVMIGGAPFLMAALEKALRDELLVPVYAFSERISREERLDDGSVRKTNVFVHKGFVCPPTISDE